jgi:hypothetical protein
MSMTTSEAGKIGGRIRAQDTGPKSLRGIGSLGYLARCVTEIERRRDELSDDQVDRLVNAIYRLDSDAA